MQGPELIRRNQARVLQGKGSPKILIGGINLSHFPNFHTFPLIRMDCSVVSITIDPAEMWRPDRLYMDPRENIREALKRLPKGWSPDFFWDPQVMGGHFLPIGLGQVPFPTIVSAVHVWAGERLRHLKSMFDCVLPSSEMMMHQGDDYLPWGASYGTLEDRLTFKPSDKPVDISWTMSSNPGWGTRKEAAEEMKAIKKRRPDWEVEFAYGLNYPEYCQLIADSKVSVNVTDWGSPMTYRPLEVIGCETTLVSIDERGFGSTASLSEYLSPHTDYIPSSVSSLEEDLETALETPLFPLDRIHEIYSYEKQYKRLFALAERVKKKAPVPDDEWSRMAFAINYLSFSPAQKLAEVHRPALRQEDVDNQLSPESFLFHRHGKDCEMHWSTDLAMDPENWVKINEKHL